MGFSFALAGFRRLSPFKLLLFGHRRTDESGGPPLFEPSLKVEWDIGHIKPLTRYVPAALTFSYGMTYVKLVRRTAPNRPTKITFADMREAGVRGLLVYCAEYRCSHSLAISGDVWPDVRLSDLEPPFICDACGKRGLTSGRISIGIGRRQR